MSLTGKVVIVTGGGSGIGRGIAELLAGGGAKVAVAEIREEHGVKVADGIRRNGGVAEFIQTDVANEDSVKAAVARVAKMLGPPFGLVNNAGIGGWEIPAAEMTAGEWDRVLSVNLRGAFLCARAAIPHMRAQGGGAIVNIASVHANFGFAGASHYDASKGGMVAFTRTLALENGPDGIRVNAICPGYIDTPLWEEWLAMQANPEGIERATSGWHPLRRRGLPVDIAKAARFLLSADAEWITGTTLVVDGGLSVRYFGL
ncbi:MAG: SDR family oxidoreductase [Bryobacteraceae bacterium]|nr:SDR family oxidoreductase [Bryobacteraceae bacterium]